MIKGGVIGFAVSVVCLLIPVLHFVLGPLGPIIGGYFGGTATKAGAGTALGIGFVMGLFLVPPLIIVAVLRNQIADAMPGPISPLILVVVAAVFPIYAMSMGTLGAAIGGQMAQKSS
jgi:hypothetical protein